MSDKNDNRQIGGYKATLHNPNTSDEAKTHAAEQLLSHGEKLSEEDLAYATSHTGGKGGDPERHTREAEHEAQFHHGHHHGHEKESQHDHRVEGGYRATLSNPNTSEEAKKHAEEYLKSHGGL